MLEDDEEYAPLEYLCGALRAGEESGVYEGDIVADMEEYLRSQAAGNESPKPE